MEPILDKKPIDFTKYIEERTADFRGREWIFQKIDSWLSKPNNSQFFVIVGEPGSGKTAIASRLYEISTGKIRPTINLAYIKKGFLHAVHFCSSRDSSWINPRKFAESLALQLKESYPIYSEALAKIGGSHQTQLNVGQSVQNAEIVTGMIIHNLTVGGGISPEESFIRLVIEPLEMLYNRQSEQQVIILVDALDEALFSRDIPGIDELITRTANIPLNVRFIITLRPQIKILRAIRRRNQKLEEVNLSSGEGRIHSNEDINKYVLHNLSVHSTLRNKLVSNLSWDNFATSIQEHSDGNFLYVSHLIQMLMDNDQKIGPESLEELPNSLDEVYIGLLEARLVNDKKIWNEDYKPIIGTLAVAQEPLKASLISELRKIEETRVREGLASLREFLDADESIPATQRTYAIYHRSFSDFLLDKDRSEEYWLGEASSLHWNISQFYLTKFGGLDLGLPNLSKPGVETIEDKYPFYHLSFHLHAAEMQDVLLNLLDNSGWYDASIILDPTGTNYISDINQAWQSVHSSNLDAIKHTQTANLIGTESWCALAIASLNSFSYNIPARLLVELVSNGILSPKQAMEIAIRNPDENAKSTALVNLAPYLEVERIKEAFSVLMIFKNEYARSDAILGLLPYVQDSGRQYIIKSAIESIRQIESIYWRILKMANLFTFVQGPDRESLMSECLDLITKEKSNINYAFETASLLPFVQGPDRESMINRTLDIAFSDHNLSDMVDPLMQVTSLLPSSERHIVLSKAITKVEGNRSSKSGVQEYGNLEAIIKLYCVVYDDLRNDRLVEGFEWVKQIQDPAAKSNLLKHLAPHLPQDLLQEAFDVALNLSEIHGKVGTLVTLFSHLNESSKYSRMRELIDAAKQTGNLFDWTEMLSALLPYYSKDERKIALKHALKSALYVGDDKSWIRFLLELAPYLSVNEQKSLLSLVYDRTRRLTDPLLQARALIQLAPLISSSELKSMFEVVTRNIGDQIQYALDLSDSSKSAITIESLMRSLQSDNYLEKALRAFGILLPISPEKYKDNMLPLAVQIASGIRLEGNRARAIMSLVNSNLSGEYLSKILSVAKDIKDDEIRAQVLVSIIPYSSGEHLNEVKLVLNTFKNKYAQLDVLIGLILHSKDPEIKDILQNALVICRSLLTVKEQEESSHKGELDLSNITFTSAGNRDEDEDDVMKPRDRKARTLLALINLIPYLSQNDYKNLVDEVHNTVKNIDSAYEKIIVFESLMRATPPSEHEQLSNNIINLTKDVRNLGDRAQVIGNITKSIPMIDIYGLWHDILRQGSLNSRRELLTALKFMLPCIKALGGEKVETLMTDSIKKIVDRWP